MNTSETWDGIFSRLGEDPGGEDPWLERWQEILEVHRGSTVLDLGCGAGYEARSLTRWGYHVVAADFSEKALELTRWRAPRADICNLDLTSRLPFPGAHFGVVVASLSIHYFPWRQTEQVLEEVRRCLRPGGHLLARLNSTNDAQYSATEKEEMEPHFYLIRGNPKRLFDRGDIDALFSADWRLEYASEQTTNRYGNGKTLWEVVARK